MESVKPEKPAEPVKNEDGDPPRPPEKNEADRILELPSWEWFDILEMGAEDANDDAPQHLAKIERLLDPKVNPHPKASEALQYAKDACTNIVENKEYGFQAEMIRRADPFMIRLREDFEDADALVQLASLNEQLTEYENANPGGDDVRQIRYPTFVEHYKIARGARLALEKNPENKNARKQLEEIYKFLKDINEEYEYPETWNLVLPSPAGQPKPPDVKPEGTPEPSPPGDDSYDPEDLFVPIELERKAGQEAGVNVCWRTCGSTELVIVQHGPPNSSAYRMEKSDILVTPLDKAKTLEMGRQRIGEKKDDSNRYLYTRRHVKTLQGVAFSETGINDPVEALRPMEKGEGRPPLIYVKVKWLINNKIVKSWETRTTVRRLFGTKENAADEAIYITAVEQEARYRAFQSGTRKAEDRSPTPSANIARLVAGRSPTPARWVAGGSLSPSPSPSPTPPTRSPTPDSTIDVQVAKLADQVEALSKMMEQLLKSR